MKLTWFAGTTMRIHAGGKILVTDAALAPPFVDAAELRGGADVAFDLAGVTDPIIDARLWRPRKIMRLIDDADDAPHILLIGEAAALLDMVGEPPLVLLAGPTPPPFGRWADGAVIVLFGAGTALVATATVLLDVARPRLIVLASDEAEVDLAVSALREHLDGAGLISLEPGLAVEV